MDQNEIGKQIEELRKKKGLTQKELAEKLGLSNTAISKWECGYNLPDISMLIPLSEVLEVDIMDLINPQKKDAPKLSTSPTKANNHPKKIFIIINILVFIFIISLLATIIQNNIEAKNNEETISNSEVKVYEITSKDTSFYINGYLIFNNNDNCFILNKIKYQDPSIGTDNPILAKEVNVYVLIDSQIVYTFNTFQKRKKSSNLNDLFNEIITNINTPNKYESNFSKYANKLDNCELRIKYKGDDEENNEINIKLVAKEQFT